MTVKEAQSKYIELANKIDDLLSEVEYMLSTDEDLTDEDIEILNDIRMSL